MVFADEMRKLSKALQVKDRELESFEVKRAREHNERMKREFENMSSTAVELFLRDCKAATIQNHATRAERRYRSCCCERFAYFYEETMSYEWSTRFINFDRHESKIDINKFRKEVHEGLLSQGFSTVSVSLPIKGKLDKFYHHLYNWNRDNTGLWVYIEVSW